MKQTLYILALAVAVGVGALAQPTPVKRELSRSDGIEPGDTFDTRRIEIVYSDGTVFRSVSTQPVELEERTRRLRIRRLRAYLRNATPTGTETVVAVRDIIRELGNND